MRSGVERAGARRSCAAPAASRRRVLQTVCTGRRTSSVATTRTSTVAARSSLKRNSARSRKPSPFGLTVASQGVSPANGVPPFEMRSPSSRGGPVSAGAEADGADRDPRCQPRYRQAFTHSLQPADPQLTWSADTVEQMRRLLGLTLLLLACTVPLAVAAGTPTDGTLSVKRGKGTLTLKVTGTIIGHVEQRPRPDPRLQAQRRQHPAVELQAAPHLEAGQLLQRPQPRLPRRGRPLHRQRQGHRDLDLGRRRTGRSTSTARATPASTTA